MANDKKFTVPKDVFEPYKLEVRGKVPYKKGNIIILKGFSVKTIAVRVTNIKAVDNKYVLSLEMVAK